MFRLFAIICEMLLIYPPLSMIVDVLYNKNSTSFRNSLKLLIILFPSFIFLTIHDPNIAQIFFVGLFLYAISFLMKGYLEIAIIIYSLCVNVNMVALWVFPVVLMYIALYYVKEGIKDGMLDRKLNM